VASLEEVEDEHYEQGKRGRESRGRGGCGAFQGCRGDVDEGCAAVNGHLLCGAAVGLADGLRLVAGEGGEYGHSVLETRVASWARAAGEGDT
jgi:hypothetical protein